ncbi:MAG: hypothetical protein HY869_20950 [Chloroflexi bacterium]|nr:hypothetical protein [Chloroflexota bacterium]
MLSFVEFLKAVAALLATLGGVAALIVMLVNAGKSVGWVKDSTADVWFKSLYFLAFVALVVQQTFFPQFDVLKLDQVAGLLAQLGGYVLPTALAVLFPVLARFGAYFHNGLRGVPIFGASHSRV